MKANIEEYLLKLPTYKIKSIDIASSINVKMNSTACFSVFDLLSNTIESDIGVTPVDAVNIITNIFEQSVGRAIVHLGPEVDSMVAVAFAKELLYNDIAYYRLESYFCTTLYDEGSKVDDILKAMWVSTFKDIFKVVGTEDIMDITAKLSPEYYSKGYILDNIGSNSWISLVMAS